MEDFNKIPEEIRKKIEEEAARRYTNKSIDLLQDFEDGAEFGYSLSEWVSCEERLPGNDKDAWFNDRILFVDKGGTVRAGCYDDEFGDWTETGGGIYKEVTHWQPLPTKPQTP